MWQLCSLESRYSAFISFWYCIIVGRKICSQVFFEPEIPSDSNYMLLYYWVNLIKEKNDFNYNILL